jgi:hypothetical protein
MQDSDSYKRINDTKEVGTASNYSRKYVLHGHLLFSLFPTLFFNPSCSYLLTAPFVE